MTQLMDGDLACVSEHMQVEVLQDRKGNGSEQFEGPCEDRIAILPILCSFVCVQFEVFEVAPKIEGSTSSVMIVIAGGSKVSVTDSAGSRGQLKPASHLMLDGPQVGK